MLRRIFVNCSCMRTLLVFRTVSSPNSTVILRTREQRPKMPVGGDGSAFVGFARISHHRPAARNKKIVELPGHGAIGFSGPSNRADHAFHQFSLIIAGLLV